MKKEMKKMVKVAESLGWSVEVEGNGFTFSKGSPAGQDFSMIVDGDILEDVVKNLYERCDSFDASEETYIWLDESGHGTNGAPYDMKDLYEDMEACLEMMEELHDKLEDLLVGEE